MSRSLWSKSKYSFRLQQLYFNLAKLHGEKCEAEEHLEEVFAEIKQVREKTKNNHQLRKYVEIILKKCPESFTSGLRQSNEDFYQNNEDPLLVDRNMPTEKSLVKLHKNLIDAFQTYNRTQNQWSTLLYDTFVLEDIVLSEGNSNYTLFKTYEWKQNIFEKYVCSPWLGRCLKSHTHATDTA
jgi:hypothetical protein